MKWFEKYGFPINATYAIKPEGGVLCKGHATVQLVKTAKNVFVKKRQDKINQSMIDYAEECRNRMY
jgi:hypothetical protein